MLHSAEQIVIPVNPNKINHRIDANSAPILRDSMNYFNIHDKNVKKRNQKLYADNARDGDTMIECAVSDSSNDSPITRKFKANVEPSQAAQTLALTPPRLLSRPSDECDELSPDFQFGKPPVYSHKRPNRAPPDEIFQVKDSNRKVKDLGICSSSLRAGKGLHAKKQTSLI